MPLERGASIPGDGKDVRAVHPRDAYVQDNGYRLIDMEVSVFQRDNKIVVDPYKDPPAVVTLELCPKALDFLIEELPEKDRFTEQLIYARRLAKQIVWDMAAS